MRLGSDVMVIVWNTPYNPKNQISLSGEMLHSTNFADLAKHMELKKDICRIWLNRKPWLYIFYERYNKCDCIGEMFGLKEGTQLIIAQYLYTIIIIIPKYC